MGHVLLRLSYGLYTFHTLLLLCRIAVDSLPYTESNEISDCDATLSLSSYCSAHIVHTAGNGSRECSHAHRDIKSAHLLMCQWKSQAAIPHLDFDHLIPTRSTIFHHGGNLSLLPL